MQKQLFFDSVRGPLFGGSITLAQMHGVEAILDRGMAVRTPLRHLAYMLATAFHETSRTMQPILEARQPGEKANPSIDTAINRLDASFLAGKLPWVKRPYWRKDGSGKSWLGRGLVQLTHKDNYDRMGRVIGVDLIANPDQAMEPGVALSIMFFGMTRGDFTGRPLSDYIDDRRRDYVNARRVINGIESAEKVAGYAERFEQALVAAGYSTASIQRDTAKPDAPVQPFLDVQAVRVDVDPEQLDKPLSKSKTVWQWILTMIGTPIVAFGGLDWRVQLLIVLVIAGFGIYAIKRRGDIAKVVRELKAEISGNV